MKKTILWFIVLCVLISGGLYARSYLNIVQARTDLQAELDKYYASTSERSAVIAFVLALPYLDDENRGRYGQRLQSLGQPGVTIGFGFHIPNDSYGSFTRDLATKMEHWAAFELDRKGQDPNDEDARWALLDETPYDQIMELCQAEQDIILIAHHFIPGNKPKSTEEVEQVRQKFVEAKRKMNELIAQYDND